MTGKVFRAAVAAGGVIGALGLTAAAAEAADTLYYVQGPSVNAPTQITPASVTLSGTIDTGGAPGGLFTLGAGDSLAWGGGLTAVNTSPATETYSVEGLPSTGSDANVMVSGGTPSVVSNGGANNYSDVEFEYDTLADYTAAGNSPGQNTQYATEVDVPTTYGLSKVSATIGAFGAAAQNSTGNTPLKPNTKYVYWLADQAGGTSDAEMVNTFNPNAAGASTQTNPSYQCLPDAYVEANAYLKTLTTGATVSGGLSAPNTPQTTPQAEIQGACVYFYGNAGGASFYDSPAGEFTTAKIGTLAIKSTATVSGKGATVSITDNSAFKAAGSLQLTNAAGDALANGDFALAAGKSGTVKLTLTSAGVKAAAKGEKATVKLTSNWGQPASTRVIMLKGGAAK